MAGRGCLPAGMPPAGILRDRSAKAADRPSCRSARWTSPETVNSWQGGVLGLSVGLECDRRTDGTSGLPSVRRVQREVQQEHIDPGFPEETPLGGFDEFPDQGGRVL